jgi:hypothetical protein
LISFPGSTHLVKHVLATAAIDFLHLDYKMDDCASVSRTINGRRVSEKDREEDPPMGASWISQTVKAFLSSYREGLEMACPVRNAASEALKQVSAVRADIDRKLTHTTDRYRDKIRKIKSHKQT